MILKPKDEEVIWKFVLHWVIVLLFTLFILLQILAIEWFDRWTKNRDANIKKREDGKKGGRPPNITTG